MCYIIAHDKKQTSYEYEESSIGYRPILKNKTTEELEELGDTLIVFNCWFKLFHHNYEVRCGMYNKSMKKLLKQIPTMKSKPLSQYKKHQKILTEIDDGW